MNKNIETLKWVMGLRMRYKIILKTMVLIIVWLLVLSYPFQRIFKSRMEIINQIRKNFLVLEVF